METHALSPARVVRRIGPSIGPFTVSGPTTSGLWFQRPTVRRGVQTRQIPSARAGELASPGEESEEVEEARRTPERSDGMRERVSKPRALARVSSLEPPTTVSSPLLRSGEESPQPD